MPKYRVENITLDIHDPVVSIPKVEFSRMNITDKEFDIWINFNIPNPFEATNDVIPTLAIPYHLKNVKFDVVSYDPNLMMEKVNARLAELAIDDDEE